MSEERRHGIRSTREKMINGMKSHVAIDQDIEAYLVDNDDAIDAVLSAITALKWWRNRNGTSFSRFQDLPSDTKDEAKHEGWIIYPTPANKTLQPTGPAISVSENV